MSRRGMKEYKGMLYILLMLKYKYFETKDVYKKFLEAEAIPFFRGEENKKELKMVYLELAGYHEELLEFRESNNYNKLAINLLEEKGGNNMKKIIIGALALVAVLVVLEPQYAWTSDIYGQGEKVVEVINS